MPDWSPSAPFLHHERHESGGADEVDVTGLKGTLILVSMNEKIADISEPDTLKHFLDLEAALGETRKIVSVLITAERVLGTGVFCLYPNEGTDWTGAHTDRHYRLTPIVIADGTQRLQYSQSVANDDFDVYCHSYWVEA